MAIRKYRIITLPIVGAVMGASAGALVVLVCRGLEVPLSQLQERVSFFGFVVVGFLMGLTDLVGWLISRRSKSKELRSER